MRFRRDTWGRVDGREGSRICGHIAERVGSCQLRASRLGSLLWQFEVQALRSACFPPARSDMNIQMMRSATRRQWDTAVRLQNAVETQVYANLFDVAGTHVVGVEMQCKGQANAKGVRRSEGAGDDRASNPYSSALKRGRSSQHLDPSVQSVPILAESSPFVESPKYMLSPKESPKESFREVPSPTSQPIPTQADFDDAVRREVNREVKRMKAEDPRAEVAVTQELRAEIIQSVAQITKRSLEIKGMCVRVADLCERFMERPEGAPE